MSDFDLDRYLEERRAELDRALDRIIPPENAPPSLIHKAMRYALFAGGKRLRPILVLAGYEAACGNHESSHARFHEEERGAARSLQEERGVQTVARNRGAARSREEAREAARSLQEEREAALDFACAVECIHTYSLVHDDLPALDDDDLRRGRPTVHRAFDDATAILVGDALLTAAFGAALGSGTGRHVTLDAMRAPDGATSNPRDSRREACKNPGDGFEKTSVPPGAADVQAEVAPPLRRPEDTLGSAPWPRHLGGVSEHAAPPQRTDEGISGQGAPQHRAGISQAAALPHQTKGVPEDAALRLRRLEALRILVSAIGTSGMIGGQVDDLLATGADRLSSGPGGAAVDEATVRSIHERKTGMFLRACPVIGGLLGGAAPALLASLDAYGADLGLAFQIVDDILDIEETSQSLGKTAGKDEAAGKATFPAAIGLPASRRLVEDLARRAEAEALGLGPSALPLAALVRYVARRRR